jgi:hypothetical protein
MQRRLRELDRADARARASGIDPYEAWLDQRGADPRRASFPAAARTRRPGRLRRVFIVAVACALPIGAVVAVRGLSTDTPTRVGFPPAGTETADTPLGDADPPPAGPDHYRFEMVQAGGEASDPGADPVRWDPCRPIHYATSGVAPVEGQEILASAFNRLRSLTGFELINDGPTSEPPSQHRAPFQPDRYGQRWAPILVAWTTPTDVPELAGDTIGLGGSTAVTGRSGRATYVSGVLFLDRPQIEAQLADTAVGGTPVSRRAQIRAVMLHEIGHITGLDHVDDPNQLMFPIARPTLTDFAAGDLRGLYRLATGPCATDL